MIKNKVAKALFRTGEDKHLFVLRVTLGSIFFAHGAQKTFGWFGGPGYDGMMQWFSQQHIPAPLAWLAIMAELLGGLGLMVGLLTRIAALGIVVNMVVATLTVGLSNGLFMNWFANQRGEGIEFYLLAIVLGFTLIVQGAGPWSLDRTISNRLDGRGALFDARFTEGSGAGAAERSGGRSLQHR